MNIKENDIVQLTDEAIRENCRLFQKEAIFRSERGKKYKVQRVVEDVQNNLHIVYVTDLDGNPIPKFNTGIFAGHLKSLNHESC